ncbi:phosphate ABC transporter permease PstA [Enteractinococcus fodinae]|uniref:Phosphate transport system permease protein PstA n=2 Tax=Enteractinococcus fodinae TaxID=684663 RepID=A0ABU2B3Y7_9MICC|nr:phosphate transport system permease protein [Enteractinococcus fodinae]
MSSQISSRPTATPKAPTSQDPHGRKKPEDMPPRNKMKRLDSLTANRKPSWSWMAAAAGAAIFALLINLFFFESFSIVGFLLIGAAAYILAMYVTSRVLEDRLKARDELWRHLVWTAFLIALVPLISVVWSVLSQGLPTLLSHPGLLTTDMQGVVGATDIATQTEGEPLQGGILHGLVGTLMITLLASVISIPVGLFASIYLVEYANRNKFSRAIRFFVDVMTGIPSIVAGLFAFAGLTLLIELTVGSSPQALQSVKTGFAAALALSVLMIPVVVRSTEEMLGVVADELREASYALGVRKWRTIMKVVLPTAMSGIASGVTLAIARVTGETAPILVTAGYAATTNWNPFSEWMTALPVFIYRQLTNPTAPAAGDPSTARAWAGALVLIVIVMGLNLIARVIAKKFAPKTGK